MNENKVKIWLAREDSGILYLCKNKPKKSPNGWFCTGYTMNLGEHHFPQIKWEDDEPTEAYITLVEPQEQPKHEIDWEQRRYEIVRDNLFHCPITDNLDEYKSYLTVAVKRAEILIKELKKQSDEL